MVTVTDKVLEGLRAVLTNNRQQIPEMHNGTPLDVLGLDSLDFAELVVRLEMEIGKDPFGADDPPQVRTIGDLVDAYE